MERCMNSSGSIQESVWGIVLGWINGTALFLIGLFTLLNIDYSDHFSVVMCVLLMSFGISVYVLFLFFYMVDTREFSMDKEGISIRYLKKHFKHYQWCEVSSITVCDVHHASKDESRYELVIRLVIGNEKYGPYSKTKRWSGLRGEELWRSSLYSMKHFKNILLLTYSPERFLKVQELSGKTIDDQRTLKGKKDVSI